jgi:DMSO/TMAO reductase YedYZ molybdopterin-dependent catalytic subunit
MAQLNPEARFAVLYCADELEPNDGGYYESIDLVDAFHPQTLLAYALNDKPLAVANGAPLRLRVERQLGYKHAKYLMRIEMVAELSGIGRGKGGYWEDRGYEWYAGI